MLKRLLVAGGVVGGAALVLRRLTRFENQDSISRHTSETADEYKSARTRILILGAGFGGMATALALDRRLKHEDDVSVLVVDRDNSLLFTPLLWTVADGRTNPNDVVLPIRELQRGRRFHVLQAEVETVDLESQKVITSAGERPYDVLVIAFGSITVVPSLPGLRENALIFHSPADAMELRNHLIDAVEMAHQTDDPEERKAWLTFVVGGGGDTGIELAATIHTYLQSGLFSEYPWLMSESVRVIVVGRADRLVPMSTPKTSDAVRNTLEAQGIEVMTGVSIQGVTDREVKTSVGDIPARTMFWAAGVAPPPIVRDLQGVEHARNGALLVDEYLRVPNYPNVYVVGDAAWAIDQKTGKGIPPTAQAAEHEGRYVARSIIARRQGREVAPFKFVSLGHLSLLGKGTGVAEIGPLTLTGLPAWLVWHGYYISHINSWRNRIHILVDLVLAGLLGRESAHLRLGKDIHTHTSQQRESISRT